MGKVQSSSHRSSSETNTKKVDDYGYFGPQEKKIKEKY